MFRRVHDKEDHGDVAELPGLAHTIMFQAACTILHRSRKSHWRCIVDPWQQGLQQSGCPTAVALHRCTGAPVE